MSSTWMCTIAGLVRCVRLLRPCHDQPSEVDFIVAALLAEGDHFAKLMTTSLSHCKGCIPFILISFVCVVIRISYRLYTLETSAIQSRKPMQRDYLLALSPLILGIVMSKRLVVPCRALLCHGSMLYLIRITSLTRCFVVYIACVEDRFLHFQERLPSVQSNLFTSSSALRTQYQWLLNLRDVVSVPILAANLIAVTILPSLSS